MAKNINELMSEYAQYNNLQKETKTILEGLKKDIIAYMFNTGVFDIIGDEHRAKYTEYKEHGFDYKRLKEEHSELLKEFETETTKTRFTCA